MKKLKICYIAYHELLHTKRWLDWFIKQGHEVHLIGLGNIPNTIKGLKSENIFKLHSMYSPLFWKQFFDIKNIIKLLKPDILHAHFINECAWLTAFSGFHPYVVTGWGSDIRILPQQSRFGIGKILTKNSLQKADLVTVVSEDLKELSIKLGANKNKIQTVIWGVDLNIFNPHVETNELKKNLNINSEKIIFSPRNMIDIYNIDIIIKSIPKVLKKLPNTVFVFAGSGKLKNNLRDLAKSLNIENNTRFVGNIDYFQMPAHNNLADICISVSSSDGTPSSMLEAMACAKPMIVSDIKPYHEWIKDGQNGVLVPLRNEEKLAETIINLLNNDQKRKQIGLNNLEKIKTFANQEQCLKKMEDLYFRLIKS